MNVKQINGKNWWQWENFRSVNMIYVHFFIVGQGTAYHAVTLEKCIGKELVKKFKDLWHFKL